MKELNLQKERDYLASLSESGISKTAIAKDDEEWDKADAAAKPIRKDMIKDLNEDIDLLKAAVKALKKPSIKFGLSDLTTNLQGIAKNITEIENQAKKSLNYNG